MKFNKKLVSILFLMVICFTGINGVKAEEKVLGTCLYKTKIANKDVSFKIAFTNNGSVVGGSIKNGSTNTDTGDAIWNFKDNFDKNFFNSIYIPKTSTSNEKINSCPELRICSMTNANVDLFVGTGRICSDAEEQITAKATFKEAKGSDIEVVADKKYCSITKKLRNKSYQIKLTLYLHNNEKMYKVERSDNSLISSSGKEKDYVTLDGYTYSLTDDLIAKYFTPNTTNCEPLYLKAVVTGIDSHIYFQTTKPADEENGSYNINKAPDDMGGDEYVEETPHSGTETINFIKKLYNTAKILIPLLIIIFSVIDFVKVLASGDDKIYKESWSNFVKRVIIGIIFFAIPTMISLLLNLSGILGMYNIDSSNIFYIFK